MDQRQYGVPTGRHVMELVLEITSAEKHLMGEGYKHVFYPAGGVVGRAAECDWVIPDQTRFISGRHAIVSYEAGQYFLTDISTNGVYVNGVDALQKNQAVPLHDGDRLTLGQIQVTVRIQVNPQQGAQQEAQPGLGPGPLTTVLESPAEHGGANPMDKLDQWSAQQNQAQQSASEWHQQSHSMPDDVPTYHEPFIPPQMAAKTPAPEAAEPSSADSGLPENWWQEPETGFSQRLQPDSGGTPAGQGAASVLMDALQKPKQDAANKAALAAFAKGLGVSVESLEAAGGVQFLQRSGGLLRLCMEGMVSVAQARASLKNEFRLDMTLVHNQGNNPIKFAADGEQAIKHLFCDDNGSFQPMENALQECFDDIKQHQLAALAGMQGAFLHLMQTLSPQALEKRFQRNRSGGMGLGSKSARYWEAYQELHRDLLSEDDLFASLFAEPFAKAYDEQIDKLKKSNRS